MADTEAVAGAEIFLLVPCGLVVYDFLYHQYLKKYAFWGQEDR